MSLNARHDIFVYQKKIMQQREVQDHENITWQCSQAFAAVESKFAEQAKQKTQTRGGKVTVICTPSGGSQTVRLQLEKDWSEQLSDDDLLKAIAAEASK
jgi:hypothetical protein